MRKPIAVLLADADYCAKRLAALRATFVRRESGCLELVDDRWHGKRPMATLGPKPSNMVRVLWMLTHRRELRRSEVLCHRCDNGLCVDLEHVYVGTWKANSADAIAAGHTRRGSKHRLSKLTEPQARFIYKSTQSSGALAKWFGISVQEVRRIKRREFWRHATESLGDPGVHSRRGIQQRLVLPPLNR